MDLNVSTDSFVSLLRSLAETSEKMNSTFTATTNGLITDGYMGLSDNITDNVTLSPTNGSLTNVDNATMGESETLSGLIWTEEVFTFQLFTRTPSSPFAQAIHVEGMEEDPNRVDVDNIYMHGVSDRYQLVQESMWLYVPPFLLVLGGPGNVLSILTICLEPQLRKSGTGMLMLFLAIADFVALATGPLRYWVIALTHRKIDIAALSDATCRLHTLLTYLSLHLSAWTLVLLTSERLLAVFRPILARTWINRRHLAIVYAIIASVLVAFDLHLLVFSGVTCELPDSEVGVNQSSITAWVSDVTTSSPEECEINECEYTPEGGTPQSDYLLYSDLFLSCVLPTFFIIVGNTMLIRSLKKRAHRKKALTTAHLHDVRRGHSLTMMLVTVSVTFLITVSPFTFYILICRVIWTGELHRSHPRWLGIVSVTVTLLAYVNNTLNFFLYFLAVPMFRQAFLLRFSCQKIHLWIINSVSAIRQKTLTYDLKEGQRHSNGTSNTSV